MASRYFFHDIHRENARLVHHARLSWDPEADDIVLEAANDFRGKFTFEQLVARSKLEDRGHRAAIRLLGDGDIKKERLDLIAANCVCWGVAA